MHVGTIKGTGRGMVSFGNFVEQVRCWLQLGKSRCICGCEDRQFCGEVMFEEGFEAHSNHGVLNPGKWIRAVKKGSKI